ncbi:MAG: biopolymer transporter ExbD [Cyanobacteria bacterium REEB459]|nr:biopolymer transporter ExbD [Cyanobacteria bacterium REEB459]
MKVDLLDTPREDARMEIIPLIDVIFCILTFFILAAVGLTRQQAISLDLPAAKTGQSLPAQTTPAGPGSRLYVSIDSLGQIYLDRQPVGLDVLYDVLQQFKQLNPTGLIVLYAARDTRYQDVVTVLDVLRSVGGDRVALATLPQQTQDNRSQSPANRLPHGMPRDSGLPAAPSLLPGSSSVGPNQDGSQDIIIPRPGRGMTPGGTPSRSGQQP